MAIGAGAACSEVNEPSAALPFAFAVRSCAPTDAPAVTILFSARPMEVNVLDPPHVNLSMYRAPRLDTRLLAPVPHRQVVLSDGPALAL